MSPACSGRYTLQPGDIAPLDRPWVDHIKMEVRTMLDDARTHSDWTTPDDVAWVNSLLTEGRAAIEVPFTARVVFPDYKHDNTTAEREGQDWRISGVFDLMEAYMGDGEASFCRQIGPYVDEHQPNLARDFVQTFIAECPPRPGFVERLRICLLADRLIIWGYGQRHPELGWWKTRMTLREYVRPYLDAIAAYGVVH